MADPKPTTRRGKAITITLDYGAAEILLALAPSPRTMGRTVSVLLHQEWTRLEERASVTAAQAQTSIDLLKARQGKAAKEEVSHA